MRMRSFWLVLVVLLAPATAHAHRHDADLFAAFTFASASTLIGFHEQYSVPTPNPSRNLSIVADLSIHHGEHDDADLTRITFLGGGRLSLGEWNPKHVPFLYALIGGVHDSGPALSGTSPAVALGGGWEYLPGGTTDPNKDAKWAVRVLADYVVTSDDKSFPRFSTGVVYRFKRVQ